MQYSSNSYTVYHIWYAYGMIGVVLIMIQFTLKQNILALVGPHVFKYVFQIGVWTGAIVRWLQIKSL